MTLKKAIEKRRSIRKFKEKKISKAKIEEILKAATLSPSAKNRQPWKFIIYSDEKTQTLIDAMELGLNRELCGNMRIPEFSYGLADAKNTLRVMKEASVLIVVLNTNGKSPFLPVKNDERIVEICDTLSIGAAVENMLLKATSLGIGSLWIANTCFAYAELEKELNTEFQITGIVALGIADEKPKARPRKNFNEVVEFK